MDLLIPIQDTTLYIRVAALIKTPNGFLFEKSKDNKYIFTIGGKIKINENSKEALKREVREEIGFKVKNMKLRSVVENLYKKADKKIHEICFIYEVNDIFKDDIPKGFIEVPLIKIKKFDVRPNSIISILKEKNISFKHIIQD